MRPNRNLTGLNIPAEKPVCYSELAKEGFAFFIGEMFRISLIGASAE
jgi:hypothetical protein